MKIGYIVRYDLKLNPHLTEKFKFMEATFTRRISSKGDRVYSKMLCTPIDYREVADNADMMKKNPHLVIVNEPFLLDDELRDRVTKWVAWANKADESAYEPFAVNGSCFAVNVPAIAITTAVSAIPVNKF